MAHETAGNDIQSVARVAQILALFSPQRPTVSAAEAARLLGLNRSTATRYLASLETTGLLRRNSQVSTTFEPGQALVQLGAFALGGLSVTSAAPPVMRRLSRATGHTVALSVWGATGPVVVHSENSVEWGASVTVRVGTHLQMNAAQTRVFLAFHEDRMLVERLVGTLEDQVREETLTDIASIRSGTMGQRVSNNGVSVFAAPIFDTHGICASLGLLGTTTALPLDSSPKESALLMEAAQDLTRTLGGTWAPASEAPVAGR
ncbi:helix-turn-helix domain-containing protein [Nocardioides zeae]|uniref:Helix-turn-helix domain-containing protein n=1 Tax=Nocardioides imazamoxiresistens TaxID=3231893 RepID=A0ABU3PUJ3_9ACTN|nr:helix-turn-helix domain-containing protein [Nocardioides zeae]MDT9592844.1 helix-turn-helix domain-containing protein [Nocardioides zeae]